MPKQTKKVGNYLVMEGDITVPYNWTAGPAASAFLTALRDDKKIVGAKCPACKKIFVPPVSNCAKCFTQIKDYVPVKDRGVVQTWTVVHKKFHWQPAEPPFALASIRLDGADTDFIHLVNADELKSGMRVRAVWNDDRDGLITDISHFEPEK